ncbi:phosphate signaling complex PhoU family protein [Halopenitus persicus]|uniref:Phosphate uptake regulator n=1 Tax=Halopenitus persicus TaxID=1048396 RepID=A0A1H3LJW5_9EURY|nr:phosphate uptake regulator PhoU [Halopenitus persicus]SDY64254.1 Phosphate uptake regulator [Halopenitus persicus]
METRKVQLSGGTTYTVSLPKQWANEHGVTAGDLLSLKPRDDGALIVQVLDNGRDQASATVDVSDYGPDEVRVAIHALYILGFDHITLRLGDDEANLRAARETTRLLVGIEVLERDAASFTIHSVMSADHVSVRKSIIRLELIVDAMQQDAVTALCENDADLAAEAATRDNEADKLHALLTRCLRRSLGVFDEVQKLEHDRASLFEHYQVARQLERIGDHAEKIAGLSTDLDASNGEISAAIPSLDRRARDIRNAATDVVLSDDPVDIAYDAIADCDALIADIDDRRRSLYDHSDSGEAYTYGIVLDSIQRTAEYGANIADIAVQRHYRHSHW